jgi:phosphopentomutase
MTLLDALEAAGVPRGGVGKVDDLFAGRAIVTRHTHDNAEGIQETLQWVSGDARGLCFVNLVDFDTLYGHRNDAAGFARALEQFDEALPSLISAMREDDLLLITADHGNDPTTSSTDHARERVPLLLTGRKLQAVDLGTRPTFSDAGATIAEWLGIGFRGQGTSFLPQLLMQ